MNLCLLQGTLQKYIDDLFKSVLAASNVPPVIKFLFDFLDNEAARYGITDPEVVHTWKCNRYGRVCVVCVAVVHTRCSR